MFYSEHQCKIVLSRTDPSKFLLFLMMIDDIKIFELEIGVLIVVVSGASVWLIITKCICRLKLILISAFFELPCWLHKNDVAMLMTSLCSPQTKHKIGQ